MKREVRVLARVLTSDEDTAEDIACAYEETAKALLACARRHRAGESRALLPIEAPLVRFELDSAPVPEGTRL